MIRQFPYELVDGIVQDYYDKLIKSHTIIGDLNKTIQGVGHSIEIFMEISLDSLDYDFINILTSEVNSNGFCKHGEIKNGKKYISMMDIIDIDRERVKLFFRELVVREWDSLLNWVDISDASINEIGGVLNGLRNTASQLYDIRTVGFGKVDGNPNQLNDFLHLTIQFNPTHTKYRLIAELATEDVNRTDPSTFTLHLATIDGTEDSNKLTTLSYNVVVLIHKYLADVRDVIK